MNERIEKLAGQALSELAIAGWDLQTSPFNLFTDRFAELIVEECIGICECEWNGDADTFAASESYNECADAIKEHFGVEE